MKCPNCGSEFTLAWGLVPSDDGSRDMQAYFCGWCNHEFKTEHVPDAAESSDGFAHILGHGDYATDGSEDDDSA